MRKSKLCRLITVLLCICTVLSNFSGLDAVITAASGSGPSASGAGADTYATQNVLERKADGDTTDSYLQVLLSAGSGSRYAGRVWSDKSVFKNGDELKLDIASDGYSGTAFAYSDPAHPARFLCTRFESGGERISAKPYRYGSRVGYIVVDGR